MLSLTTKQLTGVTGGLGQDQALKIITRKFPGASISTTDIAADGRAMRTLRGGWRFAVQTAKDGWEYIVSPKGRVMKDPMGQGDL